MTSSKKSPGDGQPKETKRARGTKAPKGAEPAEAAAPAPRATRSAKAGAKPKVEVPAPAPARVFDPTQPLPDDLTMAEILAATPPAKPRRSRKRETAKTLGVYDADRDILDQYLYEVSMTPLLTPQHVPMLRAVLAHRTDGDRA